MTLFCKPVTTYLPLHCLIQCHSCLSARSPLLPVKESVASCPCDRQHLQRGHNHQGKCWICSRCSSTLAGRQPTVVGCEQQQAMGTGKVPTSPRDASAVRDQSAAQLPPQQPLVMEVGNMGAAYWSWVHKPVPGKPRFFQSTALENITRCPWWVVPLVWVPIYLTLSTGAVQQLGLPVLQLAALQMQGVVLWQFLEYLIHRFLFHCQVSSYWGITVHFLFHGNHHKFPKDGDRLVFPPLPAAAIASTIYAGLRVFLEPPAATGLMSGVVLGYIAYDCLHYSMHHASYLPGSFLQELKTRHSHHHYHDSDHGYGISSVIFDQLLGTRAAGVH